MPRPGNKTRVRRGVKKRTVTSEPAGRRRLTERARDILILKAATPNAHSRWSTGETMGSPSWKRRADISLFFVDVTAAQHGGNTEFDIRKTRERTGEERRFRVDFRERASGSTVSTFPAALVIKKPSIPPVIKKKRKPPAVASRGGCRFRRPPRNGGERQVSSSK